MFNKEKGPHCTGSNPPLSTQPLSVELLALRVVRLGLWRTLSPDWVWDGRICGQNLEMLTLMTESLIMQFDPIAAPKEDS